MVAYMKCPCFECITYVMCKQKELVRCSRFSSYADILAQKYGWPQGDATRMDLYWEDINLILPKLNSIREDNGDELSSKERLKRNGITL